MNPHGKATHRHHEALNDAAHGIKEGQNCDSGDLVEHDRALAAMRDSAQDSEWLAIAQNIPDGKQMQARAEEEVWQALWYPYLRLTVDDICMVVVA